MASKKGSGAKGKAPKSPVKRAAAGSKGSKVAGAKKGGGKKAAGDAKDPAALSWSNIQLVQNLIEKCLQMYMSQKEVLYTLEMKGNVEPGFTQLVWQKLEEQNKEFFQAYALRLQLRDQIALFNHLLEQQAQALQKGPGGAWARGQQPRPNTMGMHAGGMGGGMAGGPMGQIGRMGGGAASMAGYSGGGGPPGGVGMGRGGMGEQGGGMGGYGSSAGGRPGYPGAPGYPGFPVEQGGYGSLPYGGGYEPKPASGRGKKGGSARKGGGGKKAQDAGKGKSGVAAGNPGNFDRAGNFKSVFSLSDLTAELGSQLATDGDVSLSLLAGLNEDSIPADVRNGFKFGLPSGLTGGTLDNVFSLSDMGKLEAPLLDLENEQDSKMT